jgi:uncharacterized oxidoreductase
MSTVLITGGSAGLGLALAREFSVRGYRVFACARGRSSAPGEALRLAGVTTIRADVTSAEDRERLIGEVYQQAGLPDILVNNAAICRAHDYASAFTLSNDRARAEIECNFAAPIELIRLYLEHRRAAGATTPASIVNISTPGSLFPLDANPIYSATKAGLHLFTLALRRHLRTTPVRVLEVFPPALDTQLARSLCVASQAAHGQEVIDSVASRVVDGVLRNEEIILPHPQSEALYAAAAPNIDSFIEKVNAGVSRRPGWENLFG